MKAARYYAPGDVRVEQIPEPEAKSGQVKVKSLECVPYVVQTIIKWCFSIKEWEYVANICGSDLHAYLTRISKFPTLTEANELSGETLPITLGHEISGTIVDIGGGFDSKFQVGQNVVIEPIISCRKRDCHCCSNNLSNVCPLTNGTGIGGWGGGLSEFIAVDARLVHILPKAISLEVGAMIEPLAVAWHAVKRSGFKPGQSALIVGAGPIGLFLLKVLRSFDPSTTIIVSEPAKIRRELALKHSATLALDPSSLSTPVVDAVLQATHDIGVDVAFDAAAVPSAVDAALLSVRPHGLFVLVGIWEEKPRVDLNLVVLREITVTGSVVYRDDHPELLEAVESGKIKGLEDLITRKIALEDVVEKGLKALINEKDEQIKILVHP